MSDRPAVLRISGLDKRFCLHMQDRAVIPVFEQMDFALHEGDAVALHGPSGAGKSSLMKLIYGTYRPTGGRVLIRHRDAWVDLAEAPPRQVIKIRRHTLGYVTQFLRVIPRVPTIDIVAEPLVERGVAAATARGRAGELLARLNIPQRLWSLSPLTFSGGEQQRVNIARGFAAPYPVLLLDEPTASLDPENRQVVIDMIKETVADGAAVIAILHQQSDREALGLKVFEIEPAWKAA